MQTLAPENFFNVNGGPSGGREWKFSKSTEPKRVTICDIMRMGCRMIQFYLKPINTNQQFRKINAGVGLLCFCFNCQNM